MSSLLEIDGSILEGGGQILRMSVAVSALLSIPIRIFKIRQGRAKSGLAAQHMKGIELVAEMCNAKINGVYIGSSEIEFIPGSLKSGSFLADPKTAGSISLLLQVALPCALFTRDNVILELRGGTNAEMAPQIDTMTEVFRPNLERFGATFDFDLKSRGYYPKGGGRVIITVRPIKKLKPITLVERGNVEKIDGWSFVSGTLPIKLAYQMSDGAKEVLNIAFPNTRTNIECYKEASDIAQYNCNGIILVCETNTGCIIGGNGLGKRDINPFDVGVKAANQITQAYECNSCVDDYTQDQLILFMALADGKSTLRVGELTLHTKTAIYISEILTKCKFNITPCGRGSNIIECIGIGYLNKH